MREGIMGRKVGMTRIFDETGTAIPVTVIEAGPCVVIQKRTKERDGYNAVQLGFRKKNARKVNKPMRGHFDAAEVEPHGHLREFRLDDTDNYQVGEAVNADVFNVGEYVDVTGISKGKGFAGNIKRWGFHRGPMTHGSKYHRGPGSLQGRDASRVFPGRKLPGRMGGERVTVQGLVVIRTDPEKNLLLVKGGVPGNRGSLLIIKKTVKAKTGS